MAGKDWADLDELFSCPESVKDTKLRGLYEALLARIKADLEAIELSTGQLIQASLMTGWTVKHLQTSRREYGDKVGYQHPGQEKDAIMALESIIRDWNDTILKARAQRDRTSRGIPVEVIQQVLADALAKLPTDTRLPIISSIATALSEYSA